MTEQLQIVSRKGCFQEAVVDYFKLLFDYFPYIKKIKEGL
jgi:hypothetical protein